MSLMAELGEGPPPKPEAMPPNMPHMQPQQQFRPPISQPPPNPMVILYTYQFLVISTDKSIIKLVMHDLHPMYNFTNQFKFCLFDVKN